MQFSILLQVWGAQRGKHAQKSGYPIWCLYCDIPVTFNPGKDTPSLKCRSLMPVRWQMWWAVMAIAIFVLPRMSSFFVLITFSPLVGTEWEEYCILFHASPSGHLYTHSRSSVSVDLASGDSTNPKADPKYLGGKNVRFQSRAWIPTQTVIYRLLHALTIIYIVLGIISKIKMI